jgi:uncharacterized protein (DUF2236 family)
MAPGGPVAPDETARELAEAVLHPPLGPVLPLLGWVPPTVYAWTLWPSIGLLPDGIRDGYGFQWGSRERLLSAWLVAAWRGWRPVLPRTFRQMPQALAADRRMQSNDRRRVIDR